MINLKKIKRWSMIKIYTYILWFKIIIDYDQTYSIYKLSSLKNPNKEYYNQII